MSPAFEIKTRNKDCILHFFIFPGQISKKQKNMVPTRNPVPCTKHYALRTTESLTQCPFAFLQEQGTYSLYTSVLVLETILS